MTISRHLARSRRRLGKSRRTAVRLLPPVVVEGGPSKVHAGRAYDGRVVVFSHLAGGEHWFHLPGVASYRFGVNGGAVTALPHPPVTQDRVRDAYMRTVLPFVLQARGWELLHASAFRSGRGVVAFLAASERGKSTLVHALGQRGHRVWADDAVAFETTSRGAVAVSLPFRVRLRQDAWAFLGSRPTSAGASRGHVSSTPPLAALFVLTRGTDPGRLVQVERLTAGRAFRAVLEHAYCFDPSNGHRKRLMLKRYLHLTSRVPVFVLWYATGLQNLHVVLKEIEGVLTGLPSDRQRKL